MLLLLLLNLARNRKEGRKSIHLKSSVANTEADYTLIKHQKSFEMEPI